ncbi:MAG: hypothetical protein IPN44_02685 [Flavobacteriales bacterium]|nr:hypothetical protein [Flavobacteriales bacterium]
MGFEYARLSNAPFDTSTPIMLRLRLFGPLLGYLTFLRGPVFVLLPWSFLIALIALCYFSARRKGLLPINALLTSAAITFTCTAFVTLYAPGYTDAITYFFILLCLLPRFPLRWKALAFAVAVCNHESALVLLPAVLYTQYLDRTSNGRPIRFFGWLALFLVPYLLYRVWATSMDPSVLGPAYYLTTANVNVNYRELGPTLWGLFWSFRMMWLLPMAAFVMSMYQRRYAGA